MGLFENITCRRYRREGMLARYAERALSETERTSVEAHLASCPACSGEVAELRKVATLLRQNPPAAPQNSLAARGELWSVLEAQIQKTPQMSPLPQQDDNLRAPSPRLERLGYLLSMPRSAPFASAVVASVLFVGVVVLTGHRLTDNGDTSNASAPAAKAKQVAEALPPYAEVTITPVPAVVAANAAAPAASSMVGSIAPRKSEPASMTIAVASAAHALRPKISAHSIVRESAHSRSPHPVMVAQASISNVSANYDNVTANALPESNNMLADRARASMTTHREITVSGSVKANRKVSPHEIVDRATLPVLGAIPAIPVAPAPIATPSPMPTPYAVAQEHMVPAAGFAEPRTGSDDTGTGEAQDIPDAHATVDVATELRRQRSLFSYATR